jgi:signal recognition particle receptor subunit beta
MTIKKTKIVFTGSVGAGKTHSIGQISDVPVILTEGKPTEHSVLKKKSTTTIAMDYGELILSEHKKLYLYGTPGQRRFDFMSQILCEGALGLIVLIDNSQENPLEDLDYYLNLNAGFLMKNPAVIGITHFDVSDTPGKQVYQDCLNERGESWPILCVDVRVKRDVLLLINALIVQIEAIFK